MAGKEKQQKMFLEGSITQMMRMDLEKVAGKRNIKLRQTNQEAIALIKVSDDGGLN